MAVRHASARRILDFGPIFPRLTAWRRTARAMREKGRDGPRNDACGNAARARSQTVMARELNRRDVFKLAGALGVTAAGAKLGHAVAQATPPNTDISGDLNVAMVANPQMVALQKLAPEFQKAYPNIKLNLLVLPENEVRDRIRTDVSTQAGQFDVVTIGVYEAANYAQNGWVLDVGTPLQADASYDYDDIFPAMKSALSYEDKLYAAPFYGESSMVFYRKDLFQAAGLEMPEKPTWDEIAQFAQQLHHPPD